MNTNVEILVPSESAPKVKAALGDVRFTTKPSRGKSHAVLLALLSDLDVPKRRQGLERLYDQVVHQATLVVFIEMKSPPRTPSGLQALTQWARRLDAEPFIAPDVDAVRRVAHAHQVGAEKDLIATASVESGMLIVWSCEPRRYEVPVSELPALARLTGKDLPKVSVSASGSRLHWAAGDIDLNLDTIREHADPEVRKKHDAERRKDMVRYGKAIRAVRRAKGLTQAGVAGLSERQVRRLEEGHVLPHASTVRKLAQAHGVSADAYLALLAKAGKHG